MTTLTDTKPELTAPEGLGPPPRTPDDLHKWIVKHLGVTIARKPIIEGHQSPFDYLTHAFFIDFPELGIVTGPADCVVWANRGGGKTFLGAIATLLDLTFKPNIDIRILAGSMDQSKRMYAHLRRFLDPEDHPLLAEQVKKMSEQRLTFHNGSTVELLAQSQTSVRGTRVQKLRCDEVDLFKAELWAAAQLTTRSKQCGTAKVRGCVECLSTMHIPHGVMHRVVGESHEGTRALFRWGVVDVLEHCGGEHSCGDFLGDHCPLLAECKGAAKLRPPEFAGHISIDDAITQKRRVSLAAWESEMLCIRPRRSDAVIPEFDPAIHVYDDTPYDPRTTTTGTWIAGMDFGIRGTAILWAFVEPCGTLRIIDERHAKDVLLDENIAAMRIGLERPGTPAWPRPQWIGVDPAGLNRNDQTGKGSARIVANAGFNLRPARRGVTDGLSILRARLRPATGEPRLFIHARCTRLIESLQLYHYNENNPQSTRPVKREGHDHAVDALRYMVQNLDAPTRTTTTNYLSGEAR